MSERINLTDDLWIDRDADSSEMPDVLQSTRYLTWLYREQSDALIAACHAEPLPPGVRWMVGFGSRLAMARGDEIPDGWEYWHEEDRVWDSGPARGRWWYEVRRIPQPATERVPLHKLTGRTLPEATGPVTEWNYATSVGYGTAYWIGGHARFDLDADGMVEVLVES